MALLYQEIMNVPGLSGTWQQRNKDLYYKLGAPYGTYQGNLQQNLWLLDQIRKNDYFKANQPWNPQPAPQPTATPVDPRQSIAESTLSKVAPTPNFQEVMPQETWNSVFDEWTRNFVNEYVLPEWQEQTYKPEMENMTRALENLNKQIGVSGSWRSGTANKSLSRAAEDSIKQEALLRQQYQSGIADLRDTIQKTWATPLYTSQMEQYNNTPWRNLDLGIISNQAGINANTMINNLASQYGVSDTNRLGELIGSLGNWDPTNTVNTTRYDWSVPKGDTSLFEQYKLT